MKTNRWNVKNVVDSLSTYPQMDEIVTGFKNNEVIAIPTETVYGLAGNAYSSEAVSKIFQAKGRPSDNPLIVHIHDIKQIDDFAKIPDENVLKLMQYFWPGPISFILPIKKGRLSEVSFGNASTVAVRMPSDPVAHAILKAVNLPLAAPSANTSGKPSPTSASHVIHDLDGKIYGVVEGPDVEVGIESTVIYCATYPYKILRPGSITKRQLESILPGCISDEQLETKQIVAPGMKYRHYAPNAKLILIHDVGELYLSENDLLIAPESLHEQVNGKKLSLGKSYNDINGAMKDLYHSLRQADLMPEINTIYITDFSHIDESDALMNRINKAVSGK